MSAISVLIGHASLFLRNIAPTPSAYNTDFDDDEGDSRGRVPTAAKKNPPADQRVESRMSPNHELKWIRPKTQQPEHPHSGFWLREARGLRRSIPIKVPLEQDERGRAFAVDEDETEAPGSGSRASSRNERVPEDWTASEGRVIAICPSRDSRTVSACNAREPARRSRVQLGPSFGFPSDILSPGISIRRSSTRCRYRRRAQSSFSVPSSCRAPDLLGQATRRHARTAMAPRLPPVSRPL